MARKPVKVFHVTDIVTYEVRGYSEADAIRRLDAQRKKGRDDLIIEVDRTTYEVKT